MIAGGAIRLLTVPVSGFNLHVGVVGGRVFVNSSRSPTTCLQMTLLFVSNVIRCSTAYDVLSNYTISPCFTTVLPSLVIICLLQLQCISCMSFVKFDDLDFTPLDLENYREEHAKCTHNFKVIDSLSLNI